MKLNLVVSRFGAVDCLRLGSCSLALRFAPGFSLSLGLGVLIFRFPVSGVFPVSQKEREGTSGIECSAPRSITRRGEAIPFRLLAKKSFPDQRSGDRATLAPRQNTEMSLASVPP